MFEVDFSKYGFQWNERLIMTFKGGSHAHGARTDSADTDWYGIFIEPPQRVIGLDPYEHFVHTTGGDSGGNGPEDVDICFYSLRKWANLAAKGNPSSLYFLFAPQQTKYYYWHSIRDRKNLFLSRGHVKAFLGFADAQLKRLFGEKGQKNIHRSELEEKFGYDTKYAMHVIRLYGEAKELMEEGKITLPRPNASELIDIRNGKYALSYIRSWARELENETLVASDRSPLPPSIKRDDISRILSFLYLDFWKDKNELADIND